MNLKIRESSKNLGELDSKKIDLEQEIIFQIEDKWEAYDMDSSLDLDDRKTRRKIKL